MANGDATGGKPGEGKGLTSSHFRRIAKNGIGDPDNAYVHGMEYFEGRLYCGMTRNSFKLLKLFPPIDPPALNPWPVDVPGKVQDLDMQGQIWCWTPGEDSWEMAYRSPTIPGKHGEPAPRDLGYRGMKVFQGASDRKPNLYVSTMSTVLRGCAAHVLRSEDGIHFEPASEPGIGNDRISTFRELVAFDGYLYAPPAGEGIQFNSNRTGVLMRSKDPRPGNWEVAGDLGFGDPNNNGIFMMTQANGQLYAGTFNHFEGYQIWTTPPCGASPLQWRKVIDRGAHRGPLSEIAMGMCEFNGALYVGSSIQNGGYDRTNLVGPGAGEIIRIWPDDSWDLLVGMPRDTPDGMKYPLSGLGPGFDNIFAGYTWRMCQHDGWLYVTTFDWSVFLQFAHRPSPTSRRLLNGIGYDQLTDVGGGFEMWRTRDGVNWIPVTLNGMDNPYNYGGRTMVSTPEGLAVGSANPFGGPSPAKFASRWEYHQNPDGGTEVFIGNAEKQAYDLPAPKSTEAAETGCDVAITGATGYIGHHVVPQLLDRGYRIRVLVMPGTEKDLVRRDEIDMIVGGLDDTQALETLVDGARVVLHMAARLAGTCTVPELRRTNVQGTHDLLRVCDQSDTLERVVFSSSVAVYQNQFNAKEWPIHESHALRVDGGHDLADYGMSKIAGENLVRFHSKGGGYDHAILRFALVYGVGDPFFDPIVREMAPNLGFGSGQLGEQHRQFVYVDDAAEAILRACFEPGALNGTFNVAGPDTVNYAAVGRITRIAIGTATQDDLTPDQTRIWSRYMRQYDISKAKADFDFKPSINVFEGVRRIVEAAQRDAAMPNPNSQIGGFHVSTYAVASEAASRAAEASRAAPVPTGKMDGNPLYSATFKE